MLAGLKNPRDSTARTPTRPAPVPNFFKFDSFLVLRLGHKERQKKDFRNKDYSPGHFDGWDQLLMIGMEN